MPRRGSAADLGGARRGGGGGRWWSASSAGRAWEGTARASSSNSAGRRPARHPRYRFVPVPDGISSPAPVAIQDVVARIVALGAACAPAFRDRLAAVLEEEEYSGDAVVCLVADAHLLPVFQVAKRMGVPALALRTGSAASYACFAAYPMLCDRGYLPVQDSQLNMPVPELPPFRVPELPPFRVPELPPCCHSRCVSEETRVQ